MDIKFTTVYAAPARTNIIDGVPSAAKYDFMEVKMTPFVAKIFVKGVRRNQEHLFIPDRGKVLAWFFANSPPSVIRVAFKPLMMDPKSTQKSVNQKAVP